VFAGTLLAASAAGAQSTTTTTGPDGCPELAPAPLQFVGTASEIDPLDDPAGNVTFSVDRPIRGIPGSDEITVSFGREARFLDVDETYVVAAEQRRGSFGYRSFLSTNELCTSAVTRMVDGESVDSGVLSSMRGNWHLVLAAVVAPLAVAIAALWVLSRPGWAWQRRRELKVQRAPRRLDVPVATAAAAAATAPPTHPTQPTTVIDLRDSVTMPGGEVSELISDAEVAAAGEAQLAELNRAEDPAAEDVTAGAGAPTAPR
jgi:hypothetical protein